MSARAALLFRILSICLLALAFTGCVNVSTMPSYARSGDIVTMGVAGIKFNTDGMVTIKPEDVFVTITDADSVVQQLKVLDTVRAFADHTSAYAYGTLERTPGSSFYADVEPFDGQWWITMHLVNPADDVPLTLAVGSATLQISVSGATDSYAQDGDMNSIPLEIIPGVVNKLATDLDFWQYGALSQTEALTIQPDSLIGVSRIGGLQIRLTYYPSRLKSGITWVPNVVPVSHDPHINIVQHTADNGDGTHTLTAMITNPMGFVPDASLANWKVGNSTFKDLNFAVLTPDSNLGAYETNYILDPVDSFYIDENGDKILGVTPVLGINY